jgi:hypothetical protein
LVRITTRSVRRVLQRAYFANSCLQWLLAHWQNRDNSVVISLRCCKNIPSCVGLRFSQRRLWRVQSCGIKRRVVHWKSTDISKKYIVSFFRVKVKAKQETSVKAYHLLSSWFLAWNISQPCIWKHHLPPKCMLTLKGLHGVISQNTELFISNCFHSTPENFITIKESSWFQPSGVKLRAFLCSISVSRTRFGYGDRNSDRCKLYDKRRKLVDTSRALTPSPFGHEMQQRSNLPR